jgi:hypothetical protein
MLRDACGLNGTTPQFIGKLNRFPSQYSIIKADRKFDGSAIDDRSFHSDDVLRLRIIFHGLLAALL